MICRSLETCDLQATEVMGPLPWRTLGQESKLACLTSPLDVKLTLMKVRLPLDALRLKFPWKLGSRSLPKNDHNDQSTPCPWAMRWQYIFVSTPVYVGAG